MSLLSLNTPAWTIENAKTGEVFAAAISRILPGQRIALGRPNFKFRWKQELDQADRRVFKLTTPLNPRIVHGLLSLSVERGFVNMHLLENAKHNYGSDKQYLRVAGNLIAYACRLSYQEGNGGYVSFFAKTNLIAHYCSAYGATQVGSQLMAIEPAAARRLLQQYFSGYLVSPQ